MYLEYLIDYFQVYLFRRLDPCEAKAPNTFLIFLYFRRRHKILVYFVDGMANTACFIIVGRNDIPIYEAEVGSAAKVLLSLSLSFFDTYT